MNWINELFFLLFGPGETWGELARGFAIIAVIIGMLFLLHRWLSRDLHRRPRR